MNKIGLHLANTKSFVLSNILQCLNICASTLYIYKKEERYKQMNASDIYLQIVPF